MRTAAYDPVADWYEHEYTGGRAPDADVPGGDPIGVDRALRDLLGPGTGTCLEIGCGTGLHSARIRWTSSGLRDKVGATHRAVPELLHAFLDAGLVLEGFAEGGAPTPATLSVRARRPAR